MYVNFVIHIIFISKECGLCIVLFLKVRCLIYSLKNNSNNNDVNNNKNTNKYFLYVCWDHVSRKELKMFKLVDDGKKFYFVEYECTLLWLINVWFKVRFFELLRRVEDYTHGLGQMFVIVDLGKRVTDRKRKKCATVNTMGVL